MPAIAERLPAGGSEDHFVSSAARSLYFQASGTATQSTSKCGRDGNGQAAHHFDRGLRSEAFHQKDLAEHLGGESEPTPAPENDKPAISLRVTTRLVQVNVVVNDKNGRPILGLDKDGFTLLDEKAQRIEFLSIATNAPTKQPATPIPPETYTNRVANRAKRSILRINNG